MFITSVNDTSNKLFTGINNTGNNPCHGFSVITGVVDTSDKFFSPVSTTPVNNYHR
jgi:hypothetical protein